MFALIKPYLACEDLNNCPRGQQGDHDQQNRPGGGQ